MIHYVCQGPEGGGGAFEIEPPKKLRTYSAWKESKETRKEWEKGGGIMEEGKSTEGGKRVLYSKSISVLQV